MNMFGAAPVWTGRNASFEVFGSLPVVEDILNTSLIDGCSKD